MKIHKNRLNRFGQYFFFLLMIIAVGCTTSDSEIKGDVATKAQTDINFAGVKYTVQNSIVLLTGNCPSVESRDAVVKKVKNIKVIKGLINQITIGPVILNYNPVLKQSVDSVLKTYPTVQADVTQTDVVLKGTAKKGDIGKLMPVISKLDPGRVQNKIKVL
jgi:hypothetical protein